MRDVVPEWMQRYFDFCSNGTLAEGALLRIDQVPVTLACETCARVFPADVKSMNSIHCPDCLGVKATVRTGMEFRIEGIEVA